MKLVDFKIEATNPTDYVLEFTIPDVSNRLLMSLFHKAKQKISKDKGIIVSGSPDNINIIVIEPVYYKFLTTVIKPQIKQVKKKCRDQNVVLLNHTMQKAYFTRKKEDWTIYIQITGQYDTRS